MTNSSFEIICLAISHHIPLRVVTALPPRVYIIFLIIQRPVVNYSLLNTDNVLTIETPLSWTQIFYFGSLSNSNMRPK